MKEEHGSVSIVLVVALAFAALLGSLVVEVARASAARARAQTAADAAALAAAQEQLLPRGRSPADVAAAYADRNGARLISCRCGEGETEAVVVVQLEVTLPGLGVARTVRASGRAVIEAPTWEGQGSDP